MSEHKHRRRNTDEALEEIKEIDAQTHERIGKIICPKKLSERIAALRSSTNKEVQRVNVLKRRIQNYRKASIDPVVERILSSDFQKTRELKASTLIDQRGNLLESTRGSTHYDMVRDYGGQLGIKFRDPPVQKFQPVDDADIHEFLKRTGTVRLQRFPGIQKVSLHIPSRLTMPQISAIKDLEKTDPNLTVGYAVGDDFERMSYGEGVRNLLREHSKQFGYKGAQGVDINVNMTYKKSKPHKMYKELFPDERGVKNAALHPSIEKFKKHKLGPEHEEGFGFDPRHDEFLTPESARKYYGKPGVSLHYVATTDNPGDVENIAGALDEIGEGHFIGGWKSSTGFKTDASYMIHTNDLNEVIENLKKHNQEATFSVDPEGRPFFVRNPHFKSHKSKV